jgi:hypothetical protein
MIDPICEERQSKSYNDPRFLISSDKKKTDKKGGAKKGNQGKGKEDGGNDLKRNRYNVA